jgi:hypothetical protein
MEPRELAGVSHEVGLYLQKAPSIAARPCHSPRVRSNLSLKRQPTISKPIPFQGTDEGLDGSVAQLLEEMRWNHVSWVTVTTGASTVNIPASGGSQGAQG